MRPNDLSSGAASSSPPSSSLLLASPQDHQANPYAYSAGYESYDYAGSEYVIDNAYVGESYWQDQQPQQSHHQGQGWVQEWSAADKSNWYNQQQAPYAETNNDGTEANAYYYGGGDSGYEGWAPDAADSTSSYTHDAEGWGGENFGSYTGIPNAYYGGNGGASAGDKDGWLPAPGTAAPAGSTGSMPAVAMYHEDYGGATVFPSSTTDHHTQNASEWTGWATPQPADPNDRTATHGGIDGRISTSTPGSSGGSGGNGMSGGGTGSSSGGRRPWSVNEFGQRVCGDWVEYWDESAQAAYFYNTGTGEVSQTQSAAAFLCLIVSFEPVTILTVLKDLTRTTLPSRPCMHYHEARPFRT